MRMLSAVTMMAPMSSGPRSLTNRRQPCLKTRPMSRDCRLSGCAGDDGAHDLLLLDGSALLDQPRGGRLGVVTPAEEHGVNWGRGLGRGRPPPRGSRRRGGRPRRRAPVLANARSPYALTALQRVRVDLHCPAAPPLATSSAMGDPADQPSRASRGAHLGSRPRPSRSCQEAVVERAATLAWSADSSPLQTYWPSLYVPATRQRPRCRRPRRGRRRPHVPPGDAAEPSSGHLGPRDRVAAETALRGRSRRGRLVATARSCAARAACAACRGCRPAHAASCDCSACAMSVYSASASVLRRGDRRSDARGGRPVARRVKPGDLRVLRQPRLLRITWRSPPATGGSSEAP